MVSQCEVRSFVTHRTLLAISLLRKLLMEVFTIIRVSSFNSFKYLLLLLHAGFWKNIY